jgi:uncharacterized protein (DUF342 family)
MVKLQQIQQEIADKLTQDKKINVIEVYADTIQRALADAAIQFDTTSSGLDYKILEKGSKGIVGLMRMPWRIQVNNVRSLEEQRRQGTTGAVVAGVEGAAAAKEVVPDTDGMVFVRRFGSDIVLKIIPPTGNGTLPDITQVMDEIGKSDNLDVDEHSIKKLLDKGTGSTYKSVGVYSHDQAMDAQFTIDVGDDDMEARITAQPPGKNGSDITVERVKATCATLKISENSDFSPLDAFIDNPVYNTPVAVVKGTKAENGHDAYMDFHFETDKSKVMMTENRQGQINFKELNLIQNVTAGQVVAEKVPLGKGVPGRTLFGKMLPAKDGADIILPVGTNTHASGDQIIADINGKVDLVASKVTVEAVMEVDEVSIKSGNINFNGSLVVRGTVDDGFAIKVTGDVKINGSVGASTVEAGGNIVVGSGIIGRNVAVIRAGKSVWAKFVQSTTLEVLENIIVTDGIVNCNVIAHKRIVLQGRHAVIAGGRLFAGEEINARTIGTSSESPTRVETGYDIRKKQRVDALQDQQLAMIKTMEDLELNIRTLTNMQKSQGLSPEKEATMAEQMEQQEQLSGQLSAIGEELKQLREFLKSDNHLGVIAVSDVCYPGVTIVVKDATAELKTEVRGATFKYKDGAIDRVKYVPSTLDVTKQE